jgi:hypothetical protein
LRDGNIGRGIGVAIVLAVFCSVGVFSVEERELSVEERELLRLTLLVGLGRRAIPLGASAELPGFGEIVVFVEDKGSGGIEIVGRRLLIGGKLSVDGELLSGSGVIVTAEGGSNFGEVVREDNSVGVGNGEIGKGVVGAGGTWASGDSSLGVSCGVACGAVACF